MIELIHPAPPCGEEDTRPAFLSKFHYTYYVQLQLVFTAVAIVLISLCTKPRTKAQVGHLKLALLNIFISSFKVKAVCIQFCDCAFNVITAVQGLLVRASPPTKSMCFVLEQNHCYSEVHYST